MMIKIGDKMVEWDDNFRLFFTTKLANRVALVPAGLLALHKRQINRTYEIMGIRTALSAGNDIMALNTRGGPFITTMQEQGLRAAIDERNARWGAYGPSPMLRDE